jgi:hypothetical protein
MEFVQPILSRAQETYASIDAVVAPAVFSAIESAGFGLSPISSATKDLPYVASPTPLVLSLMAYFMIVGSGLAYRKVFPRTVKVSHDAFSGLDISDMHLGTKREGVARPT